MTLQIPHQNPRMLIPAFEACPCGRSLRLVLTEGRWVCDECGNPYPWPGIRPMERVNGEMVVVLTEEDKARQKLAANSARIRVIAADFKAQQAARRPLPGITREDIRREIARQALAGKIEFNRKHPGSFDIEACRADYERVVGPLGD